SALERVRGQVSDHPLVKPEEFKDRIVIIGASAVGLADLKATPVRSAAPGSTLHAAAISNMLTGDYLHVVPTWVNFLFLALSGTLCYAGLLFIESLRLRILVPSTIAAGSILGNALLFRFANVGLDWAAQFPMFLLLFLDGLIYLNVVEGREKRKM